MLLRTAIAALLLAIVAQASRSAAQEPASETGSIAGVIADAATGAPLEGVRVILIWPTPADDSEPREEVDVSDAKGGFEFASVPVGSYSLEFIKPGFTTSSLKNFLVAADQVNRADQRMAEGAEAAEPAPDVEEILVLGARVQALEASRQESDELINTLSAAEISKFAASDVADVILRIPGVNVVEGQFAIIRGLEDRYTSTLYNSAVVPSPDPDRQSPQLDLFPSEIVSDLVVAKSFGPDLPSNSSGGSINVLSSDYPDEFETRAKFKLGFNENAIDRFLRYDDNNPAGVEVSGIENTYASEGGAYIGMRTDRLGRELRLKLLGNWESDYETGKGFEQELEPVRSTTLPPGGLSTGDLTLTEGRFDLTTSEYEQQKTGYASAGLDLDEGGDHGFDVSLFWTDKEQEVVELGENGYFDDYDYLRPGGPYETQINNFDFLPEEQFDGADANNGPATSSSWIATTRGGSATMGEPATPLWFSSFMQPESFQRRRDLMIPQINGHNDLEAWIPGLEFKWVGNWARTTQRDEAYGARMWYEPCGYSIGRFACASGTTRVDVPTQFPATVEALGPGSFFATNAAFSNDTDVTETQWFGRLDGDYETELTDWLSLLVESGGWYEKADRDVDASFFPGEESRQNPACRATGICLGSQLRPIVTGPSAEQLGQTLMQFAFLRDGSLGDATKPTTNESEREIQAGNFGARSTFFEALDLLAGLRVENIYILSDNDPFLRVPQTATSAPCNPDVPSTCWRLTSIDRTPEIYPSKFLFFDRYGDNPVRDGFLAPPPFNDEVLGLPLSSGICRGRNVSATGAPPPDVAVVPGSCVDLVSYDEINAVVDGEIDELEYLPSVGLAYRPLEGLALRAAWSQTVARPSFREMGYYVSVEPATDDLIVGNPQLQLSDVESWDARVEYFYGDYGDLIAVSGFYKTIDKPIETIIVRNPINQSEPDLALFRTFFNNPNEATLWGLELEARKNLGFLRDAPDIEWLGIGKRLRFLDNEYLDYFSLGGNFTWIDAEVDRTEAELARTAVFFEQSGNTIDKSRRLYGQPEWMANADITFEQPDWGSRVTLAFYGISDVLDAAGAATVLPSGQTIAYTLDRYVDSFHKLDLTFSQEIWRGAALKFTAKNLTDSRRELVYDPAQTSGKFTERSLKLGRDYSLELSYTFSELPDLPFFDD